MNIQILNFLTLKPQLITDFTEPLLRGDIQAKRMQGWILHWMVVGLPEKSPQVPVSCRCLPQDHRQQLCITQGHFTTLGSFCHSFYHWFSLALLVLKFTATVTQWKLSSRFLIPSQKLLSPTKPTYTFAHTPLSHKSDTLSFHNIPLQLRPMAHVLWRVSWADLEEWFSHGQQTFSKL